MYHRSTPVVRYLHRKHRRGKAVFVWVAAFLLLAVVACTGGTPSAATDTEPASESSPASPLSIFDSGDTAYGFFPSSPEITAQSLMATIEAIGQHGDIMLNMPQVPWADFIDNPEAESQAIEDMRGSIELARQHGLEIIFVIDPLQAFDRRVIATMPDELAGGDFSTPGVRSDFMNYAMRLVREFHPRYLGLASEINTYADARPEDFSNYVTLYHETYAASKAEAPDTLVFVTIQWEDLNSVGFFSDFSPGEIKWDIVDQFEPDLDVYAISTYPYFAFEGAAQIPEDYYSPLLSRTSKPLAIAEGGFYRRRWVRFTDRHRTRLITCMPSTANWKNDWRFGSI